MTTTLLALRGGMVLTGVVLVGLAGWTYWNRNARALRPFVGLTAAVGALAVLDGFAAGNPTTLSLVWLLAYLAIPAAFTWFVVEYYGLPHLATWGRKAAFLAPAAVGLVGGAALILSPSATGSMTGANVPASADNAFLLSVARFGEQVGLYFAGGVMLAGVALLVRTVAAYDHLDARLGVALSFVTVWPWVAYLITPGVVGSIGKVGVLGMTTGGYATSGLAALFAVTRGGLFDAAPAAGTLGPETVLSELDDAVVVVDHDQRVVRVNAAAAETFGFDAGEVTGTQLSSVVGATLDDLRTPESVELAVPGGTRRFEASVSPVRDRLDRQPGHAVVLADVTQERVRAQRLAVLHRVLRHNLRNEMARIVGRAEVIAEADHEYADSAEAILDSANDLVDISDRANDVKEVTTTPMRIEGSVGVADIATDVAERYRERFPEASLSVDADESLAATVDGRLLARVLDNLVENALVHNDAPTPVVTVSGRQADDETVRISVVDNGPGIPDHERAVIEAGRESPLEHGTGLGLWAVKWGVVRMGGELEFTDNEPEGTVVTVRLPAESAAVADAPTPAEAD